MPITTRIQGCLPTRVTAELTISQKDQTILSLAKEIKKFVPSLVQDRPLHDSFGDKGNRAATYICRDKEGLDKAFEVLRTRGFVKTESWYAGTRGGLDKKVNNTIVRVRRYPTFIEIHVFNEEGR